MSLLSPHDASARAVLCEACWRALGAILASRRHVGRDLVAERALLEATLERLTMPAFRALVLARLARLAASAKSVELADRDG